VLGREPLRPRPVAGGDGDQSLKHELNRLPAPEIGALSGASAAG
jgi:hypothetical protein